MNPTGGKALGHVMVADAAAANRLHRKSAAGTLRDGALHLHAAEAAYCHAKGWLEAPHALDGLDEAGLALALAYADWRTRGFVVRIAADGDLEVLPRGKSEGPPSLVARAHPALRPLRPDDLDAATGRVLCLVDDDGVVTHYQVAPGQPQGNVQAEVDKVRGRRVAEHVLVRGADADRLAKAAWGAATGDARLLSAAEAAALAASGRLVAEGGPPTAPPAVLAAMKALRAAGAVPKSGLRFGTHLRAYAGLPDDAHADWLVHCLAHDGDLPCSDLARGVRLAHGVRKRFLVAVEQADGVRFHHVSWLKV